MNDADRSTQDDAKRRLVSALSAPADAVEVALSYALYHAAEAGRFDVVAQLARELEARRVSRGNVVTIETSRADKTRKQQLRRVRVAWKHQFVFLWSIAAQWTRLGWIKMQPTGAYTADRTSALSGVPKSTIHYWARTELLVPSVSISKVKLWSYADLMGLRIIYWLRQQKTDATGAEVPKTSMRPIRHALHRLRTLGEPLWHPDQASIWVDRDGELHLRGPAGPETIAGQTLVRGAIDLIAPFSTREGLRGPNLAVPRPELRIAPGRLSGSPHVVHTRLETRALFALHRDGLADAEIRVLYRYVSHAQLTQALDLEEQLEANLAVPVAA